MKKVEKYVQMTNEAESIIKSLSGHFESDRKILLDGIQKLRMKNANYLEVANLGVALYRLLLENGLNESDIINPERLMDKVDGFMYAGNFQMALDILEVLDALEIYQSKDIKGNKVFCFNDELEAKVCAENLGSKDVLVWLPSNRAGIALAKANVLAGAGKIKEAKKMLDFVLEINPANFEAMLIKANAFQNNPTKFRAELEKIWRFAYKPEHMVAYLVSYAEMFTNQKELVKAYAVLSTVRIYDNSIVMESSLKEIENEMQKTVVSPYSIPTFDEVARILEREKINAFMSATNKQIMIDLYKKCLKEKSAENDELIPQLEMCLGAFIDGKQLIKEIKNSNNKK